MITSDHCSASVFVNSWLFLINLIATGIGQSKRMLFFLFEYLISPCSSFGSWKLLCFMWDYRYWMWLIAFHTGKKFFAWEQVNMTMQILREKQCSVGGGGLIQTLWKEGARPFSQYCGLQFGLKILKSGEGVLLGGVLSNKGAIVKENMFYFGEVGENIPGLTYSWHDHVDTEKKLKRIHGPRILWQNRREITNTTQ